uniref:Uncharacterized protein n=1 Tax=Panstrongylus lignarius TaxID=156445 RepID=A0A224XQ45_9HEMI
MLLQKKKIHLLNYCFLMLITLFSFSCVVLCFTVYILVHHLYHFSLRMIEQVVNIHKAVHFSKYFDILRMIFWVVLSYHILVLYKERSNLAGLWLVYNKAYTVYHKFSYFL